MRQYLNQRGTAALHVLEGAGLRRGRGWEGFSATTFLLDLIFQD